MSYTIPFNFTPAWDNFGGTSTVQIATSSASTLNVECYSDSAWRIDGLQSFIASTISSSVNTIFKLIIRRRRR